MSHPAALALTSASVRSRQRRIRPTISSICARVMTSGGAMIMRSPTARMIRPLPKQWPRQTMPTSSAPSKRGAGGLVLDELQRAHQAAGLHLADQRVVGQLGEVLGEVGPDVVAHTLSTRPSRWISRMLASATAQATGWPE